MRTFIDAAGNRWEVVVGKESFGTLVLLFSGPETDEVRKIVLAAETPLDAERELEGLSDGDLRLRLAGAAPW